MGAPEQCMILVVWVLAGSSGAGWVMVWVPGAPVEVAFALYLAVGSWMVVASTWYRASGSIPEVRERPIVHWGASIPPS